MEAAHETKLINRLIYILMVCLLVLFIAISARADDWDHRLGQGGSFALGIGAEVSYGNYGDSADATVVTLPLLVSVNPFESLDITFELPLVYLSSKGGSGVVVTQSGGAGRRRGATGSTTTASVTTTTTSATTASEAGLGDISLSAGWTLLSDSEQTPRIRPTLYLKVPSGDKTHGLGTGTLEAGPGLSVSKWLSDLQLFAEGSYILQDSFSGYQGKNYFNYSGGAGLQTTERLFLSLYAKGSSPRVTGGTAPLEGRIKLNFLQSRRMSWEVYALAGLSDASPTAGGGMLLMYQF